jgi:hypothetical protein
MASVLEEFGYQRDAMCGIYFDYIIGTTIPRNIKELDLFHSRLKCSRFIGPF